MLQDRLAARYARALFGLAQSEQKLEEMMQELQSLRLIFNESAEFHSLIASPIISNDRKVSLLETLFRGKAMDTLVDFMVMLAQRSREAILPYVIDAFKDMYHSSRNITEVELISMEPLPGDIRKKLVSEIESQLHTQVKLDERSDDSLIGGFKLKIGYQLYDASISTALKRLQLASRITP